MESLFGNSAIPKPLGARSVRCGMCSGCTRTDCGRCMNCADKKCNGGRGIKKQACMRRVCVLLQANKQCADADDDELQYGVAAQMPVGPVLFDQPRPGQHANIHNDNTDVLTDVLEALFQLNKQPDPPDVRASDFPEAVRRALAPALPADATAPPAPHAQVVAKPCFVRELVPVPVCLPACRPPAPRLSRCGVCVACNANDCGVCKNCRDKLKFGGRGVKKQACVARQCLCMQEAGPQPIRYPQFYGAAKSALWAARADESEGPGSSSFEPCSNPAAGDPAQFTGATQSPVLLGTGPAGRPEDDHASASTTASTQGGYGSSPRSLLPPLPPRQLDVGLLQRRFSTEDRAVLLADGFGELSPKDSSSLNILSFVTAQAAAAASAADPVSSVARKRGRQPRWQPAQPLSEAGMMFPGHEQPRDEDLACERDAKPTARAQAQRVRAGESMVRSWRPSVEYVRRLARRPVKLDLDRKRRRSSPGFYSALLRSSCGSASVPSWPRTPKFKHARAAVGAVGMELLYERVALAAQCD